MIKFRLLAVSAMMILTLLAGAADLAALRRAADDSQAAVTAPGAGCNQAGRGEKFAEFIVKFTVDPEFNAQRTRMSQVFALKPIANYKALVVSQGHEAGYSQVWKSASPDEVQLICGFADSPADYVYVFRRQPDGTWHLVVRSTPDF